MTALVLEGRQLASHKDVRLAEGDKPIGTTHELQAQCASAPILGHQTLTTSLRGGIIIISTLRLREVKVFGHTLVSRT